MKKQNMKKSRKLETHSLKNLKRQTPQTMKPQNTGPFESQEIQPALRLPMTSDLVFRTVLGRDTPECKKALAAVLNLILNRKEDPIVDLEYKNPFHLNQYMVGKQTVMDIKVATSHGEIIDVEMQVGKTKDHAGRSILYTGQISVESLESGKDYGKIKRVAHISIVSGNMEAGSSKYHGVYRYLELGDKTELSDLIELHYLKLDKLPDLPLEEMSPLKQLGYYIANAGRTDLQEEIEALVKMGEEAIVLTDEILRKASQEEILREQEIARKWWEMDQRVEQRANKEEGRQEGIEQGIRILIKTCKELDVPKDTLKTKLMKEYNLQDSQAEAYLARY